MEETRRLCALGVMYFLILPDSSIGVERERRGAGRQPGSAGVQPPCRAPAPALTPRHVAPLHRVTPKFISSFFPPRAGHEETRHHDAAGHGAVLRGVLAHLDAGNAARAGTWHPKPCHGVTVPCLSPSPGPHVGPPAVGALPALIRRGDGLGTGGSGGVGDSRTRGGSSMTIV